MASKPEKTTYDALLRDARAMTDDLDLTQEEDYSLEEILAEYGGGRQRKILADVERAVEKWGLRAAIVLPARRRRTPST